MAVHAWLCSVAVEGECGEAGRRGRGGGEAGGQEAEAREGVLCSEDTGRRAGSRWWGVC